MVNTTRKVLRALLDALSGLLVLGLSYQEDQIRELLWEFGKWMERQDEFKANEQLATLDPVFVEAGYPDMGFRWTTEDEYIAEEDLEALYEPLQIFWVKFTNAEHTSWKTL